MVSLVTSFASAFFRTAPAAFSEVSAHSFNRGPFGYEVDWDWIRKDDTPLKSMMKIYLILFLKCDCEPSVFPFYCNFSSFLDAIPG
jgi:hypothetical protein